jgi:transglutaminase-like putative cysteine protease
MITARRVAVSCALAALSVAVALAFGRVYGSGRYVVPLVIAAVLPHVLGMAARARRAPLWLEVALSGVILIVGSCLALGDFSPATLFDRLDAGWQIVLHHAVPIPATPSTVLLGAVVVWIAATAADILAFRYHAAVGAAAPGAMAIIWIAALGDHDGQWLTIAAFGIAAILFLALQHQALLERRRTRLGGRRIVDAPALVGVAVLSGIAALLLGVAAAPALPGGDRPLFEGGPLGVAGAGGKYKTSIAPFLDVSDKLRAGNGEELFTVKASTADYWRITALDQYSSADGGNWTLNAQGDDAVGEGLDGSVPRDALTQEYQIGQLGERWMPAAYKPVRVSRQDMLVVRASATLVTSKQTVSGLHYQVESATPTLTPTAEQIARAASPAPAALRAYTDLPADFPEDVQATARVITRGLTSAFDKALALRDFFRTNGGFTYDRTVTFGDGESAIQQFLSDRRGFCVQFASAYATMARAVGIPARVAVGFTPGTRDSTGIFRVTSDDAHAWPEIWLTGLGWTHLFDPTPPSNEPGGSGLPTEPPASDQSNSTVTTSPPVTQPAPQPTPESTPLSTPANGAAPAPANGGGGVTIDRNNPSDSSSGVWWLVLAALVVLGLVVGPVVPVLALKARRRAGRRAAPSSSLAIEGAWREAIDELIDRRIEWPPSDTPHELAERVPALAGAGTAAPMRNLADAYGQVRYGDIEPPTGARDAAWGNVDALRKALDSSSTPMERIRAHLSTARLRRQPDPAGWSLRRSPSTKD